MHTVGKIVYVLILLVCLAGVVWFVLSTIADAGRRLTRRECPCNTFLPDAEGNAKCMNCGGPLNFISSVEEIRDPTIPEDEPAKLRVIRGGKGGS